MREGGGGREGGRGEGGEGGEGGGRGGRGEGGEGGGRGRERERGGNGGRVGHQMPLAVDFPQVPLVYHSYLISAHQHRFWFHLQLF